MLRSLSGRTHEVITGVCLIHGRDIHSGIERTTVTFAALSDTDIAWYVATGEPRDKAGAYHVDGRGLAVHHAHRRLALERGRPARGLLRPAGP
jgi:predicted house-cleaning NTP pyrophosphatase (Maf/HAM1 superfamily)